MLKNARVKIHPSSTPGNNCLSSGIDLSGSAFRKAFDLIVIPFSVFVRKFTGCLAVLCRRARGSAATPTTGCDDLKQTVQQILAL